MEKFNQAGLRLISMNRLSLEKTNKANRHLASQIFVLTGSLASLTRGEAKDKIKALGGQVKENVTKETTYVVVGAEPGSKYEKAKKMGIKVLDEIEFIKLIS